MPGTWKVRTQKDDSGDHILYEYTIYAFREDGWSPVYITGDLMRVGDALFIAHVHQALPHWIKRYQEAEKQINNFLTFGQSGASFEESQWLDKLSKADFRAEQAEAEVERMKEMLKSIVKM
jgi:hypothetical protein